MQEALTHEIAGKKYVLVDVPFIEGYQKKSKAIVNRHGLLYQGIKKIDRGGWLSRAVIIQTYFCPEQNFEAFSKEEIEE